MKLAGKWAVVTGAASGIGRASSFLFAREGAAVLCADIDSVMGEETAAIIRKQGGSAHFVHVDLADAASIDAMARSCITRSPKIHVLFNNAAVLFKDTVETTRLEDWNRSIAVNLTAPYLCSVALLPALKAAGGASIVHNGSIDGVLGNPHVLTYSVSKGGLTPLTHIMAHSLAPYGIRVNCINAGGIGASATGIPIRLTPEMMRRAPMNERMKKTTPLARQGNVEEMASVALFLASDDSSYMTGVLLTVDGGRTALTPGHVG